MAEEKHNNAAEMPEEEQQEEAAAEAEATLESEAENLQQAQIESLENQRDEYKDALIRERADFENYKKRNASLEQAAYHRGIEDTAVKMLPVLDNFERALQAQSSDEKFQEGMEMIMRQLQETLSSLGVKEMDTSGTFDPNLHHAVMQTEEEGKKTGEITETLQKGYMMKDKVIRPAMVKVNK